MGELLITNGRIIDPSKKLDLNADILITDGLIKEIGTDLSDSTQIETIDAAGKWVVPGLIDMHVHLREPGREDKETIETGTNAAAAGGFTAVACMANTDPVNDCQAVTRFILTHAINKKSRVYPIAAITKKLEGMELTEMAELIDCGAVAFSDDGKTVKSAEVLRRALEYSQMFQKTLIEHCEDSELAGAGVMHEGYISTKLGLTGIPSIAEDTIIQRDIQLAEYTGGKIHIAHVSTQKAVHLIKEAKKRGVQVTAEVTPHHLFLNDESLTQFDTNLKMKPPLRSEQDRLALVDAVIDGTIDCIASDHAPHTVQEKDVEFDLAPFGIIGIETALALVLTKLYHTKKLTPLRLIEAFSTAPSKILGVPGGTLQVGSAADITIVDPEEYWIVDPSKFVSKSSNSPFAGWSLRGKPKMTLLDGKIVFNS